MRKAYLLWLVAILFGCMSSFGQAYKNKSENLKEITTSKKITKTSVTEMERKKEKMRAVGNKQLLSFQKGKSSTTCPDGSLFSNPLDGFENATNSENELGYSVATTYFADGNVKSITFWSINGYNDGTGWMTCENESVESTSTATGEYFLDAFEIYQNTIVLPTACDLTYGVVAITALSENSCWFMWIDSPNGSGEGYQYSEETGSWEVLETPLSLCISGDANSCLAPQSLSVNNITDKSADLGWIEMNGTEKWQVSFAYLADGAEQVSSTVINVNENPYTVEQLSAQSYYKFSARSVCAEGDTSLWSMPEKFRTACDIVTEYPMTEDFDGDWNNWCWEVVDADEDGYTWNQNYIYIDPVLSGEYAAHGMGNMDDYLITPLLSFDGIYQIQWFDKVESSANNNTYEVLVSNSGKELSDFTINLGTFDCTNEEWTKHTLYLDEFEGQTVYIAFHQIYSAETYYGFGIEDVKVSLKPDCIPVTNLSASNITKTSADLSWQEDGDATAWNIEYGLEGFVQGEGTIVNATDNQYTITDLTEGTYYEFYVQAACTSSDAEWVGPYGFATACETGSTISESFENRIPPICWNNFENGAGTKVWEQTDLLVHSGSYAAVASYEDTDGLNSKWLVTGRTTISAGKYLEFYTTDYFEDDFGSTLSVRITTNENYSNTDDYTDLLTISETDVVSYAYSIFDIDLSDYAGEDVFIAFVMEDNNGDVWFLDDVSLVECPAPSNIKAENITATSADITWSSNATAFNVEYGEAGFELGSGTTLKPTTANVALTDLEAGVSYDVYVKAACSDVDESNWAGPYTFITANLPCDTITEFPYNEGFEGLDNFDCWTVKYNTADDGGISGDNLIDPPTENTWGIITPESFEGNGSYYIYEGTRSAGLGYNAPDFNWLISPDIQVPATGADFSFMLWLKDSVSTVVWITKFYVNIYDGTSWVNALTWGDGSDDNEYEAPVVVSLSEYANKTVKVAFVYEYNDGYELAVDNVAIQAPQTAIASYSIPNGTTVIDAANHKVEVTVPTGTDLTSLVATFTLSAGATAKIGNVAQVSGVTANNFTNPVTYTIVAQDGTTTQDWVVTVTILDGVNENLQANVKVYPNPTSGIVTIEGNFENTTLAQVIDITGKVILSMQLDKTRNIVDLSSFESGLYFVQLVSGNEKAMYKISKQ